MNFKLTKKELLVQSLIVPNTQELVIGYKKNGLLKRDSLVVAVKNSNPFVETKSIGALSIKPKPKWHDRLWFKGVCAIAGWSVARITTNK
jgi:hypothetical protein